MKLLTWVTTFTLIILAELGDKTQIATLILASNNPRKRWVIFGAAASALTACVLLEVTLGVTVAKYLPQVLINKITGIIFIVIGLLTLYRQYVQVRKWKMSFDISHKIETEKETKNNFI